MKRFSNGPIIALAAIAVSAIILPAAKADEYNRKTVITISNPVEVALALGMRKLQRHRAE